MNRGAPKRRIVSAAPFRDRGAQRAFCAVVEPLFERGFVHDGYVNRKGKGTRRRPLRKVARPFPSCAALRHPPVLSGDRPRDPEARSAAKNLLFPLPRRCDHRRLQPPRAGRSALSGRRPLRPVLAQAWPPDRQPVESVLRQPLLRRARPFLQGGALGERLFALCRRLRAFPRRSRPACGVAAAHRPFPGRTAPAASPGQDPHRGNGGAGGVPGIRPAARRRAPAARGERAAFPQSSAKPPRAAGRVEREKIRRRMDRSRRTRRHLAASPGDLSGRVAVPGA